MTGFFRLCKKYFHTAPGLIASVLLLSACGSPPVLTWEEIPLPKIDGARSNLSLGAIRFINGNFFAVGGFMILSSPDGKDWSLRHKGKNGLSGIAHGSGAFVAVGSDSTGSGGWVLTSSDGSVWENTPLPEKKWLSAVTYGKGRFVAVGYDTTVLVSTDGKSWSPRKDDLPRLGTLYDVEFGNGLFVATGQSGTILTSPDGFSWTQRTSDTRRELYGIAFGDGRFVAVSNDFWCSDVRAFVSRDGVAWEAEDTDSDEDLRGICFGGGVFMAVGGNNRSGGRGNIDITQVDDKGCEIVSSRNGEIWRVNECPSGRQLHGVAFGNNRFVAVGNGIILRSSPLR